MNYSPKINKFLYYFLNLTWGSILTFVGFIISLVLLCTGRRSHKFAGCWYFNIGKRWGGLNLGLIFLTDSENRVRSLNHEYGHSLQNAVFGPFMIFLVAIPSVIRYWIFQWRRAHNKPNPDYDAIWFEGTATKFGYGTSDQWKN